MSTHSNLVVPHDYQQVEARLLDALQEAGFLVRQAFRLSEARGHPGVQCRCPQHGTEACRCEWCTYLVYDKERRWVATLTLYGHENQTRISCRCDPQRRPQFDPVWEVFTTRVTPSPKTC